MNRLSMPWWRCLMKESQEQNQGKLSSHLVFNLPLFFLPLSSLISDRTRLKKSASYGAFPLDTEHLSRRKDCVTRAPRRACSIFACCLAKIRLCSQVISGEELLCKTIQLSEKASLLEEEFGRNSWKERAAYFNVTTKLLSVPLRKLHLSVSPWVVLSHCLHLFKMAATQSNVSVSWSIDIRSWKRGTVCRF